MKICNICNVEKPLDFFGKNSKRYFPYCKQCYWIKYGKPDYERKKDFYQNAQRERRKELRDWFTNYKKELKCSVCEESRHWCLDFHHPSNDKEGNVSKFITDGYREKAIEEIQKCVVLCKNCHSDVHYQERIRSGSISGNTLPS